MDSEFTAPINIARIAKYIFVILIWASRCPEPVQASSLNLYLTFWKKISKEIRFLFAISASSGFPQTRVCGCTQFFSDSIKQCFLALLSLGGLYEISNKPSIVLNAVMCFKSRDLSPNKERIIWIGAHDNLLVFSSKQTFESLSLREFEQSERSLENY